MNSIGVLSAVLFAVFTATNALECNPVMCMLACPFGFEVDASGCPRCSCRTTANVCREPIFGYNCGTFDHRDCPSSHECQLSFSGLTGQCCLKPSGSTTARPTGTSTTRPTGTSTARPTSGTSTRRPTTGTATPRSLRSLLSFSTGPGRSSTPSRGRRETGASGAPVSTTPSTFNTGASVAPGATTPSTSNTGASGAPGSTSRPVGQGASTPNWFDFDISS